MPGVGLYGTLILLELALALPSFLSLLFLTAPYGRYQRDGWGPTLPARLGWVVMESPAAVLFAVWYLLGPHRAAAVPLVLLGYWQLHYCYRAFVYPLRMRAGSRMPLGVVAMAVAFNVLNGYVNAHWVAALGDYPTGWFTSGRFLAGTALFAGGLALNVRSDRALRRLRAPGETGYRIPRGGAFELVSCPNYLGEMVEWTGWALATWSPAGLAFAVYTAANLAPRALAHHAWYRREFPDYPPTRRALIPYLL